MYEVAMARTALSALNDKAAMLVGYLKEM